MGVRAFIGIVMLGLLVSCQREDQAVEEELEAVGFGMTVAEFHRAAGLGDVEVMASMLEHGVDPLGKVAGDTAMHVAARAGKKDVLEFLLEEGVPVGVPGARGRTPLMAAAEANKVAVAEFLMVSGADLAVRDDLGYRAMTLAAETGSAEVVEVLARSSRESIDDALFLATLRGEAETVAVLVESGASVYARMEDSRTVLMLAAQEGKEEVVRVLLNYGANRFAIDDEGLTAGQIAMEAGQLEVGEFLLEAPEEEEFFFLEISQVAEVALRADEVVGGDLEDDVEIKSDPPVDPEAKAIVSTASTGATATGATPSTGVAESTGVTASPGVTASKEAVAVVEGGGPVETGLDSENRPNLDERGRVQAVEMREYHERSLPMRIEGVEGKSVQVRYLYGVHKTVTVQEGEAIPFTGLRVVSVQERRRRTKESGNSYADVSAVLVEDPRTGLQRELVTHLAARAHDPFAIVTSRDGVNQVAHRRALIHSAEGEVYRVLDVRPTQVVMESVTTGEVETITLARRK